ncbi:hypothetical protein [Pontiella agarivorans]|uniref:Glycosyl hydrolases family 43 n=1 Tax=Pontiella agarivorans TaxID=3038953 RepID=A0ABU5N0Q2_9BACT|nr:hypothetical protein [Pontiella agarivorans]MDZ8120024.1 hypothetical protein [Pontiella agarivorans]
MNKNVVLKSLPMVGVIPLLMTGCATSETWTISSRNEWLDAASSTSRLEIVDAQAKSIATESQFTSAMKRFDKKRALESITFKQTTAWDNWKEVPNVGPEGTLDAVVLIPVKDGDYWLLARKYDTHPKRVQETLKHHTYDEMGYHAWHSTDMETWTHYGPVSGYRERWVTTAEYADGKFYIYYDNPNDQDPHLIIDSDLRDGKMGEDKGMVFADPSHGSDCAIFRDEDERFHLIYENWDPINAKEHSWDSPLAGHAVSPDGINDFKILPPAVDHRTNPTGKWGEYVHSSSETPLQYEIHEPEQNAYGDWTAIKVGGQYYLFCDYDPVGEKIRIGRFTSDSLDKEFSFCGELGGGHPDPSIGFAEGRFYLLQQQGKVDFISPGPWVPGVEARAGVDTTGDGKVDQWSDWQEVKETYSQKPGFARIVETTPARLDLSSLPEGYGFCFEYRTVSAPDQNVNVVMDQISVTFK